MMQGKPVFIGISQRVLNVRPTAFFFIKCSLQSNEIQQLYCSAEDGYESTQLYTMPMVSIYNLLYFLQWTVTVQFRFVKHSASSRRYALQLSVEGPFIEKLVKDQNVDLPLRAYTVHD